MVGFSFFFLGQELKGSFEKRVRIDLPVPLPVPTHPPLQPFPYFFTGKPPPPT